jgi:hypothetical protein
MSTQATPNNALLSTLLWFTNDLKHLSDAQCLLLDAPLYSLYYTLYQLHAADLRDAGTLDQIKENLEVILNENGIARAEMNAFNNGVAEGTEPYFTRQDDQTMAEPIPPCPWVNGDDLPF